MLTCRISPRLACTRKYATSAPCSHARTAESVRLCGDVWRGCSSMGFGWGVALKS